MKIIKMEILIDFGSQNEFRINKTFFKNKNIHFIIQEKTDYLLSNTRHEMVKLS